ncbi:MAG: hypothetical protein ACOX8K_10165 [Lachnospiraceae bacterium]|jgi:hypothetical protein
MIEVEESTNKPWVPIKYLVDRGEYKRYTLLEICRSRAGEKFAKNTTGGKWMIHLKSFRRWEQAQDAKRRKR